MQRFHVSAKSPDPAQLHEIVALLKDGRVVAVPTDTLYGLAADATNADAIEHVFALKGRDADAALPLIAADQAQVEAQIGRLSPDALRLAQALWPGPLTLIVDARSSLAAAVHGGRGTVAVRVPNHEVARALARLAGVPLTATSANLSGAPAVATADEVAAIFGDRLAALVDAGPTWGGLPSTIVDVTSATRGEARLVRAGAVPWERVLEFL